MVDASHYAGTWDWTVFPPQAAELGLRPLVERFPRQRRIGKTYGSLRSVVALRTPSGPQETESELETELVHQLAFAMRTYDILTQHVIEYEHEGKLRTYAIDAIVDLSPRVELPCRYVMEAKRADDLAKNIDEYRPKFRAAARWTAEVGGEFRVVTEAEIRTPYLRNVRLLHDHRGTIPRDDLEELALAVLDEPRSVRRFVRDLMDAGMNEPDARQTVERMVARCDIRCDLTLPFSDSSIVGQRRVEHVDLDDPIFDAVDGALMWDLARDDLVRPPRRANAS